MSRSFLYVVLAVSCVAAATPLAQRLVSPDADVRAEAVTEFNRLPRDTQERFVPTLMVGMSSDDSAVHDQSAALLKILGAAPKTAPDIPPAPSPEPSAVQRTHELERREEIKRLSTDRYKDLKKELEDEKGAAAPLASHDDAAPKTDPIRDALIDGLHDSVAFVRSRSARRLGNLQPAAVDAIPALRDLLKDADPECRGAAAGALGSMGPRASEAIPDLRHLTTDPDANVRAIAAAALIEVGGESR